MSNRAMDLDNLPDELKALYAHRCPGDAERKAAYEQSVLSSEPDSFVLYRIIGNDLYPRHAKGQSRQNVRFILENEPELADCEKRWVLNRIFDAGERQAIIELLEQHGQSYLEIPFEAEAFVQIGWDYSAFPEPGFLSSVAFHKLGPLQQERVLTAAYRKKNLYLMNNNGARNAALEDGRGRAKWVLPWDGNCFVTPSAWDSIRSAVRGAPYLPYFAVPMQRITDNAELLRGDFTPSPVEEPQLLFRRDARERFGENHPYGRRPKVELLWRLGIPGKWDRWKDDPWEQPRAKRSADAGAWGVAGWVARLASGAPRLEEQSTQGARERCRVRRNAIQAAVNHVIQKTSAASDLVSFTCYRLEAIEALRAEYQELGEATPKPGLLRTLLQNAEDALERQPESPVDKPEPGPSGDLQDYYRPAPYWWPNPDTGDGLPYVRRDGERVPGTRMYEPESHRYDRTRLQRLFDDSTTLALAAFVTGDQRYATHGVRWLERWFIDPATRMNPHLTYAQVRWGHNKNRGAQSGVIEMKDLYYALDAVRLLHHIGALPSDQLERLRAWFRDYLHWLLTSEQGTKEAQARNNHGTYYDLQVAAIAAFLDDHDTLYATLARAEERIPLQISPTGIQYEEMTRTITAHYCCFALQGWLNLFNLAARFDGTFVERAAEPEHPLRNAVEWLLSHERFPWPYPQISEFDHRRFVPIKHLFESSFHAIKSYDESNDPSVPSFPSHDGVCPYWLLAIPLRGPSDRFIRPPPPDSNFSSGYAGKELAPDEHPKNLRSSEPTNETVRRPATIRTFVFSKNDPPTKNFFSGYAFIGEHIIFGAEGFQKYQDETGEVIPYGEDGCYTCVIKVNDEITVGTDYVGNGRLFYYREKHFWAFSNSFYRLAKYLMRKQSERLLFEMQPSLEPQRHLLEAFNIRVPFGNQLQSFQTVTKSIKLLPSSKFIQVKDHQLEIHDTHQPENQDYQKHLQTYLNLWLSRIYTVINSKIPFSVDVTGGLDSRTTLAMFLRVRKEVGSLAPMESVTFNSSEKQKFAAELRIAQALGNKYGFPVNSGCKRTESKRRSAGERFSLWKDVALGTYSPYRVPAANHDPNSLSIGGGGGECFRLFYKKSSEIELLEACKKFFSSRERFLQWKRVVLRDFRSLQESNGGVPPLVSHYRHFRTRFHTGTTAHYRNMMLPLQSKVLFFASHAIEPYKLESRQIAYDIIASCKPELLHDEFDALSKRPSDSNWNDLTILSPDISRKGVVFGVDTGRAGVTSKDGSPVDDSSFNELVHRALNRCARGMAPDLLPLFSVEEAKDYLVRLENNDQELRPKEGRQVHNVLLSGFLCGVDI